ncbi:copper resistance protein CopC [Actinoplanes sp. NBC_00393]|uniref:copper resistance CopC family protein n=1 Tax=Actinoplanes sp. NBC_00393 TaxID=2975953 RepID=UPI002E22EC17
MSAPVRLLLALVAALLVLAPGAPAWAHNALAEASPAKKATLKKAPTEVKLRFLQKLDPDYTTITVSSADKQQMPASEPAVKGSTGTITLEDTLPNGVYTVAYQVVSTDGHTVKGSYEFTVADPSATEAPSPSAAASSSATGAPSPSAAAPSSAAPVAAPSAVAATEESSGNGTIIAIVIAVVVVLAGLAGFLYARRRKA